MGLRNGKRLVALLVLVCFCVTVTGCASLKPDEYEKYGYHGQSEIHEGKPIWVVDVIGNILGAMEKLILWNWKVERHRITEDTKATIDAYLAAHPELGNVDVELNRWTPVYSFKRLHRNKGVKWPYRYTLGLMTVIMVDVILVGRIFGGDHYNPYTHTVNLYSDLPSIALHELGHAKDFSARRYRGSYSLFRVIPFADLYQEYKATDYTFTYVKDEKLYDTEIESYKVLYPAYGTYVGGYLLISGGTIIGAVIGHVMGRAKASDRTRELEISEKIQVS